MPVKIHAHESGQLQEAGIDGPATSFRRPWHGGDDVTLKPGRALVLRQRVDRRGIDARVDGAACKDQ